MTLVPCERCGFIRVDWAPCETCANDFGLGEIMPDVGRAEPATYLRHCPDTEYGKQVHELHQLVLEESNLTHLPNGGYVHIGKTKCARCGEEFYYVVNVTHHVSDGARKHIDEVMSLDFGEMVASAPPCRS